MTEIETYKIKIAKLLPNKYGNNDIVISMVSKYKDSKFDKHVKLDKEILDILLNGTLLVNTSKNKK
tara:strand:- start:3381 stop:3578 length:198 start_codon:yes stop_codon:yes gene_type:complete